MIVLCVKESDVYFTVQISYKTEPQQVAVFVLVLLMNKISSCEKKRVVILD